MINFILVRPLTQIKDEFVQLFFLPLPLPPPFSPDPILGIFGQKWFIN